MPGALRPDTEAQINQAISATEKSHGVELAVVVVQSPDGLTIEDYAVRLFKAWGIGKKDRDNGLLFLWSTGDRQLKVEVGYGLEGAAGRKGRRHTRYLRRPEVQGERVRCRRDRGRGCAARRVSS
jgi:uncharacterized protein